MRSAIDGKKRCNANSILVFPIRISYLSDSIPRKASAANASGAIFPFPLPLVISVSTKAGMISKTLTGCFQVDIAAPS